MRMQPGRAAIPVEEWVYPCKPMMGCHQGNFGQQMQCK